MSVFPLQLDEAALDTVTIRKEPSAGFALEQDRGGIGKGDEKEEEKEEEYIQDTVMGVGKNTTSKTMDNSSEGANYEEESKHGDFYPVPVPGYVS